MKQCFLIDDDKEDHDIFCIALSEVDKDIVCHKTDNAAEALRIFKNDLSLVPEVIFIDVNMPKIGGISCLKQLRELPQLKHVLIYMYSTTFDDRVNIESAQYGAKYIVKPSNINTFITILQRILNTECNLASTVEQDQSEVLVEEASRQKIVTSRVA